MQYVRINNYHAGRKLIINTVKARFYYTNFYLFVGAITFCDLPKFHRKHMYMKRETPKF